MKYVDGTQDGLNTVDKLASMGGMIKVTRIEKTDWNEMEGQNYTVTVKATAPEGKVWGQNKHKNIMFQFDTNSTWIEPDSDDEEAENMTEQELIREMVYNVCL